MDLINRLKNDQSFVVRLFVWGGKNTQFTVVFPADEQGAVVRFGLDPKHTFIIDGSGKDLRFTIDYMTFKAKGKARFDFGETADRYGMYKCGEVSIEFLKVVRDETFVSSHAVVRPPAPDCELPLSDTESPRRPHRTHYAGYKGYTHAAWTHKN